MAESTGANQQRTNNARHDSLGEIGKPDEADHVTSQHRNLYLIGPLKEEMATQPLINSNLQRNKRNAPSWLRPFFSLRIQLTLAYSLLLILMIAFTYLLLYQQPSSLYMLIVVLSLITSGTILTFVLTTLLLRPLWRVTDAAQAIAIGDLEQKGRLPLRLPPQDEIDRLAGSINEMVIRLERAEKTQIASQERFHQFFSDASHQLRTPLTSIRGFTELLLRGAKDDPENSQRILKRMKNESERMTLLINDLLTLARLDDTYPLKLQYIDLLELAVESIEQARVRANDEREIQLVIATQERLGLQADKERVKQLLFILLDNALKYGQPAPDGKITLKVDKRNGYLTIFITDNGEGVAIEDLEHIFESFYRGRRRLSPNGTPIIGTGLGLTIASAIVHAHQGTITVSTESGCTEFKVLLPCPN
jgi:two-component system OmpR family sensor kinase